MRLRLLPEAKSYDPLGCEAQTPRPCVLFSPMPCRHQAPCGAPTPTGITETRPGGASVRLAAKRIEAWMTVTSCRAGTRSHHCFMSKGGAACVHFRKVMPPSRWKGEARVTVRSGHSHPSPLGWRLPLQCLGSSQTGPLVPASARHFQLETHRLAVGRGLPSERVWWRWAQQGPEFWWDTACRKPWAAFSQSPASAEDSGDGPRAPTWTWAQAKKSKTLGPGQERGGYGSLCPGPSTLPTSLSPTSRAGPGPSLDWKVGRPLKSTPRSLSPPIRGAPRGQSQAALPQGLVVPLTPRGSRQIPPGLGLAEADLASPTASYHVTPDHSGRATLLSEGYRPSVKTGLQEATSWPPTQPALPPEGQSRPRGQGEATRAQREGAQPPSSTKGGGDKSLLPQGETMGAVPAPGNVCVCCRGRDGKRGAPGRVQGTEDLTPKRP